MGRCGGWWRSGGAAMAGCAHEWRAATRAADSQAQAPSPQRLASMPPHMSLAAARLPTGGRRHITGRGITRHCADRRLGSVPTTRSLCRRAASRRRARAPHQTRPRAGDCAGSVISSTCPRHPATTKHSQQSPPRAAVSRRRPRASCGAGPSARARRSREGLRPPSTPPQSGQDSIPLRRGARTAFAPRSAPRSKKFSWAATGWLCDSARWGFRERGERKREEG
jgi:hypothetical protein